MLNKILKVTGIFACLTVTIIGVGVGYEVICRIIRTHSLSVPTPAIERGIQLPFNQAMKAVEFDIVKTHQDQNTVLLLISISNMSNRTIPVNGLDINVLNEAGELIDKCTQGRRGGGSFIKPKQKTIVKVVCTEMNFLQEYSGEVKFIPSITIS